ncbi:MAG TPA: hypothetical protein VJ727_08090 [Rhodanobacteraceae bacterium]|nr:hypothetical protein [Rhodanobacteraceae bacterium]
MNIRLQAAIGLALIGLSTVAISHKAQACGLDMHFNAAGHWSMPMYRPSGNLPLALPKAAGAKQVSAYGNPLQRLFPLTGLYQATFTAEGNPPPGPPDGTVIDQPYVTWHADGTELMNSSRNSASGNFCMGVWERTGPHNYSLNHYALAWDPTGQVFIGPAKFRESIDLANDNNSYTGTFSIDQYAPDGVTLLGHVQGDIAATRITVDSN